MEKVDLEFSLQPVPQANRNGFWKILAVMLGFTFFSASMWSGGTLGNGLSFVQFIWIVLAGNLILGIYTGALAYIAAKTGLSTHLLTRYAFGEKGSYLSSLLLGVTQVGWFGVGVAMFAVPVQKATDINVYLLIAISGVLMTVTAIYGIKALAILGIIAVPSIAILGGYSVLEATDTAGGIQGLMGYQPHEALGLAAALTICIGSFISGGTLTADFARFAKTTRSAVVSTVIAFFLGNSLMFLFGAVGAIVYGKADISDVMFLQGLIIPAIIVLGLNIWTTNENALYASSLGFANITKIAKNKIVIFNGIIGTIAAMWLYNNFVEFLTILGSTLPSIGAIILADYFLLKRRNYKKFEEMKFKAVNWIAIIAWAGGVVAANFVPGIPPINGLLGTAIIYVVLMKCMPQRGEQ
ncbi:cytosine permease [Aneurinibacillus aneurinilyticus]|uniref:Cytosine permease n=2 Tax=Aneurinibacillus aneurinilyticus TaxID=1391 RepID=A0A848CS86_ANEAE|nr:cytosine permease [Aneurinibacillus aneurinilyticus]ERI04962.1 cytosine permease [Aneurinibacillus aneurinilyticus ATCC 12856]MCI1696332.1 cytosine permease [Aneurinibacillus aneurinilyticus]MED0673506.1 cytosine permease [Aneurinibacillus aneurinilyticus]MED0708361.1 cytosine permease [Aneurinibacillus aneurinilyticus]MED0726560.1 cytosine permease [Aneurinibacillus aneurinilyticus]